MHATFSFTNFHYHTFQLPLILNIWVKVKRNIREKKFSSYASSFFFFFFLGRSLQLGVENTWSTISLLAPK